MKRWPDLLLRMRIEQRKAALAKQRQLFDVLRQAAQQQHTERIEHVRNCDNCKAQIREQASKGRTFPEDIREAAGIAKVLS